MPFAKRTCTHAIIISLWLICYIQCGFIISNLSIPGLAAHDRYNISHVFTFSFLFLVLCLLLLRSVLSSILYVSVSCPRNLFFLCYRIKFTIFSFI